MRPCHVAMREGEGVGTEKVEGARGCGGAEEAADVNKRTAGVKGASAQTAAVPGLLAAASCTQGH